MAAKKVLRDSSAKSLGTRVLLASVAAGAVTTGRAAMIVNPAPDSVYKVVATASSAESQLAVFQATLSAASSESNSELQEIQLEITAINEEMSYLLELNTSNSKSGGFPPEILGPFHFVGILLLTHAIAEGALVGADSDFTESQTQIDGTDVAYFGFTLIPPSSMQSRSNSSADATSTAPLYGWVKLDGSSSVTDPDAPEPSESVMVNWAYDDSGLAVIVGSAQPIPEASTLGLVGMGLSMAGAAWYRRRIKPGVPAARGRVAPKGRWQVWEAQRARQSLGLAPATERLQGDWVIVAGDPQTLVGMATLRDADPAKILQVPSEEAVLLEIETEPAWDEGPAAEALLDAALTQARQTSARQVIFATGNAYWVELAARRGFTKAARKETHHGRAREAAAWLKARYEKALMRHPVTVRPIREAKLEAVQRLVSAAGLLKVEQVRERGPGVSQGFDAPYSFFVGDAEQPSALILGFEHQGRVRLHVRLRDAKAKDFPHHGMIALIIAFLDAVTAAGVEEVSFVTRSRAQSDFATLARRWGAHPVEFLETLRLPL